MIMTQNRHSHGNPRRHIVSRALRKAWPPRGVQGSPFGKVVVRLIVVVTVIVLTTACGAVTLHSRGVSDSTDSLRIPDYQHAVLIITSMRGPGGDLQRIQLIQDDNVVHEIEGIGKGQTAYLYDVEPGWYRLRAVARGRQSQMQYAYANIALAPGTATAVMLRVR